MSKKFVINTFSLICVKARSSIGLPTQWKFLVQIFNSIWRRLQKENNKNNKNDVKNVNNNKARPLLKRVAWSKCCVSVSERNIGAPSVVNYRLWCQLWTWLKTLVVKKSQIERKKYIQDYEWEKITIYMGNIMKIDSVEINRKNARYETLHHKMEGIFNLSFWLLHIESS